MDSLHAGFQDTGGSVDTEATFRWLDQTDGHPLIQEIKHRMLDLCPPRAGGRVLDVGCGLGHEVRRLAERVGPQGRVVGIARSEPMIAEAQRRTAPQTMTIVYQVRDAHQLTFPDNTFDLARIERVLRYLDRPVAALREMVRVVRSGGSVLAFDFDSDLPSESARKPTG